MGVGCNSRAEGGSVLINFQDTVYYTSNLFDLMSIRDFARISTIEAEYFCYLLFAGKAEHGVGLQRWKEGGIYI